LEDLRGGGKLMLTWNLKKEDDRALAGFVGLRMKIM
jgi:hypothetical protein